MSLKYDLQKLNRYPYHMPGHKRNEKFGIIGASIDITEIDGYDNLHNASGSIKDIEDKLSLIYKSTRSFISVGGSTLGILAAIHSVCSKGDKIIVAKNCHKSVFSACMLLELEVIFVEPAFDFDNGFYTRVEQATLNDAISSNPDAKAVLITSPTYEGYISDIKCDIPLIIDSAHGAHMGVGYFPKYAKGDIVVSSLHKTLPALTQTGVINVYNDELIDKVKRYIDIFETSSPSYVLMNSIDICCDYILNNKQDFISFYNNLCDFRDIRLDNLRLKYNDDISKIVITTNCCNINAVKLADILRHKYQTEPEMISESYIILMSTIGDTKQALSALKDALIQIDNDLEEKYMPIKHKPPVENTPIVISYSDYDEATKINESKGKRANEFIFAYPPDIPIIMPNEIIKQEHIDYIVSAVKSGINIVSDSGLVPNKILTKRDI